MEIVRAPTISDLIKVIFPAKQLSYENVCISNMVILNLSNREHFH